MSDPLDEILGMYFAETEEGLDAAEASLAVLADGTADREPLNIVFRAVHSIKGSSGAFGFNRTMAFAHGFENLLDALRAGSIAPTQALWRLCERARDTLADHVAADRVGGPSPDDADLLAELARSLDGESAPPAEIAPAEYIPAAAGAEHFMPEHVDLDDIFAAPLGNSAAVANMRVLFTPSASAMRDGPDPILPVRELLSMGAEIDHVDCSGLPALSDLDPSTPYIKVSLVLPSNVDDETVRAVFAFMPDDCIVMLTGAEPAPPAPLPCSAPPQVATAEPVSPSPLPADTPASLDSDAKAQPQSRIIRVELEKLDRIVALVGELVISNASLEAAVGETQGDRPAELTEQHRLTRELQDAVLAVRAQPVRAAFDRLPRVVRELEGETGKRIRLLREGEHTEVDKTIIERIGEPLVHLIRNACDHGIEPPDERIAAGKDPIGRIALSAGSRGSKIVITVTDDGRGIDRARVLSKAVERGIVPADQANTLAEAQIDDLIFAPGFSTAAAVTSISGRGVGMDVVRKNVASLGGKVSIASEPGAGSTVTMTLPLSLAIVDGMTLRAAGCTFVLPLASVLECIALREDSVQRLSSGAAVLNVRSTFLPVRSLATELALEPGPERLAVIVDTELAGRQALLVDSVVDQRQIVIKDLEANYGPVHGISGATILGDGSVALILDAEGLIGGLRQRAA